MKNNKKILIIDYYKNMKSENGIKHHMKTKNNMIKLKKFKQATKRWVRKHINYKDDYDDDTISEKSNLHKKRKIENLSHIDSFEMKNRSNKNKEYGLESNSLRHSKIDSSHYGDKKSRNHNNVNINLGNNKVKIKLNDDNDDDEQENNEEIHLDEDEEDEK